MGAITVNVDDKTETRFRKTVKEVIGTGKGRLGKAITEAMNEWVKLKSFDEISKRQLAILKKGFDLGGSTTKNRAELHERGV